MTLLDLFSEGGRIEHRTDEEIAHVNKLLEQELFEAQQAQMPVIPGQMPVIPGQIAFHMPLCPAFNNPGGMCNCLWAATPSSIQGTVFVRTSWKKPIQGTSTTTAAGSLTSP